MMISQERPFLLEPLRNVISGAELVFNKGSRSHSVRSVGLCIFVPSPLSIKLSQDGTTREWRCSQYVANGSFRAPASLQHQQTDR